MKGAGGGKRKGRKAASVETDDRPRGYESQRMRQLWRDIDDAKHKAGIGPAPEAAPTSAWDFTAALERTAALAGEVAAWVAANAPSACGLLADGAELLRSLPIVGRLVDLVPGAPRAHAEAPDARARRNGAPDGSSEGPMTVPPEGAPNGHWIH